jgi:hypothetical protein
MTALLLLTTSLHYLAIIPICKNYQSIYIYRLYSNVIMVSTTFSMLWHYYNTYQLMIMDYYFATIWFLFDIGWYKELNNNKILILNLIVFIFNIIIINFDNYVYYHNIWNIISAIKCMYISYLIRNIKIN